MITSNSGVSNNVKIVGIGGLTRSGKDSLAELFMENGFFGVSFGDIIRGYARKRHADKPNPITVANMTETANWLRNERGADAVLKEALSMFEAEQQIGKTYDGLVLYSVRAPVEVDFILAHKGHLVWAEASDQVRYQRMLDHQREGEAPISFEEFMRQENLQTEPLPDIPVSVQMNAPYVKQHATEIFDNDKNDLEDFMRKGLKLVKQIAS